MAAGKFSMEKASGGVASITVADGTTNTDLVLPESGTVATTSNIVGFKNYIINGNFDVWQYAVSQTTAGYGSDDRWANMNAGSTKTHSRMPCTDTERVLFNADYFSRTVVTSVAGANNYITKDHKIENITKLAGKTVTLSFWAKADSNKNISISFGQLFGTGGTPSSYINGIGAQLVTLTTTWQRKTITVTLPSIIGKTLGTNGVNTTYTCLQFFFDAGSNLNSFAASLGQQSGTFDIAQVQLEEGSIATPFENRPYGLELSLCHRYYQRGFQQRGVASAYSIGYVSLRIPLHTSMRVIPTISQVQGTTLNLAIEVIGIGPVTPTSMVFGGAHPNALQVDFGYTSLDNQINPVTLNQDIIQCSAEL